MSIGVQVYVMCDRDECTAQFKADSSVPTMALHEASEEGWKVNKKTEKAYCPQHRGGASLIALGAGAM